MSDSKQKNPSEDNSASLKWEDRLRESLNRESVDESSDEIIRDEDDELKELLRAQLFMFRQSEESIHTPGVSESEDADEDDDEYFEDEEDEYIDDSEAEEDEYIDESEVEEDEYIDESEAEEDEYIDESEAADDEYIDESEVEEDEYIDESEAEEDEYIDESEAEEDEYIDESEAEEDEYIDESGDEEDESIDDDAIEDEFLDEEEPVVDHEVAGVSRAREANAVAPDREVSSGVPHRRASDELLNGRQTGRQNGRQIDRQIGRQEGHQAGHPEPMPASAAHSTVDDHRTGSRRSTLSEENARLLREVASRKAAAEDFSVEHVVVPAETQGSNPAPDAEPTHRQVSHSRRAAISYDPLQIGREGHGPEERARVVSDILDEVLPIHTPDRENPEPAPTPVGNYTANMPSTDPVDIHQQDAEMWADLGYGAEIRHAEDRRAVEQARSEKVQRENRRLDRLDEEDETPPIPEKPTPSLQPTSVPPAPSRTAVRIQPAPPLEAPRRSRHGKNRRTIMVRALIAVIGTGLLLLFDCLPTFTEWAGNDATPAFVSTIGYPMVSMLLTALLALPFATRLWKGFTGLFTFTPRRYSTASLALLVHFLYTCADVILILLDVGTLPLYGGLALCTLAIAAVAEHLNAVGDRDARSLLSAGKPLYVLTDETTPATVTLRDEYPKHLAPLSAVRTRSVDRRAALKGTHLAAMDRLNGLLPAAGGLSVVVFAVSLVNGGDWLFDGVRIFTVSLLSALPAAYLVALSFPFCYANRRLGVRGCAVVGAAASDMYAKHQKKQRVVCFHDGDILRAVRRTEIIPHSTKDPNALPDEHWRRLANRLFHLLHSPLAVDDRFEDDASPEALAYLHVEIAEQGEYYTKLYLIDETPGDESTVEVMMGSHEALTERGVRLTSLKNEKNYRRSEDSHVLYIAVDGRFRIAYAVEYRVRKEFSDLKRALAACHARPAMVTYDPILTPRTLESSRFAALRSVQILRPDHVETSRQTCAGGLVALDGNRDLIHPLLASRGMSRCHRFAHLLSWGGLAVTAALLLVAVLTGYDACINTLTMTGLHILLTALAALLPMVIITRRSLRLPPPEKQRFARAHKPKKSKRKTDDEG